MIKEFEKGCDKHYTVRFKNKETADLINETFQKTRCKFNGVKNAFLCECINRGVKSLRYEFLGHKEVECAEQIICQIQNNSDKINEFATCVLEMLNQIYANLKGILALSSSNQEMLIGLSEESPKLTSMVEDGFYDTIPKRVVCVIEELLKSLGEK